MRWSQAKELIEKEGSMEEKVLETIVGGKEERKGGKRRSEDLDRGWPSLVGDRDQVCKGNKEEGRES